VERKQKLIKQQPCERATSYTFFEPSWHDDEKHEESKVKGREREEENQSPASLLANSQPARRCFSFFLLLLWSFSTEKTPDCLQGLASPLFPLLESVSSIYHD